MTKDGSNNDVKDASNNRNIVVNTNKNVNNKVDSNKTPTTPPIITDNSHNILNLLNFYFSNYKNHNIPPLHSSKSKDNENVCVSLDKIRGSKMTPHHNGPPSIVRTPSSY